LIRTLSRSIAGYYISKLIECLNQFTKQFSSAAQRRARLQELFYDNYDNDDKNDDTSIVDDDALSWSLGN